MIGEYPPLRTLEEAPLHCAWLEVGDYWACQFPELPPTEHTMHDWRCHGCIRHAESSLAIVGDRIVEWYPNAMNDPGDAQYVQFSWLVERSKALLGMQ